MNLIFNESEKEFIRENYGEISYPEMAKRMNRDWMDIRHCATKMGIRTKGGAKSKFSGKKAGALERKWKEEYYSSESSS